MSILKKIDQPITDTTRVLEHEGDTYTFIGRPDASVFGRTMLMQDVDKEVKVRHWKSVLGIDVDKAVVGQVMAIQSTLVRSVEDGGNEDINRYDETDIAKLSAVDAFLFNKLFVEAAIVLGFATQKEIDDRVKGKAQGEKDPNDALETVAAKN